MCEDNEWDKKNKIKKYWYTAAVYVYVLHNNRFIFGVVPGTVFFLPCQGFAMTPRIKLTGASLALNLLSVFVPLFSFSFFVFAPVLFSFFFFMSVTV